jgi:hypothetical protein
VGERIAPEDKQRLEDTAAYLVRNALSLKKLVYLDGQQAVLYRSKLNPLLGRNFQAMDPLEWLARMSDVAEHGRGLGRAGRVGVTGTHPRLPPAPRSLPVCRCSGVPPM